MTLAAGLCSVTLRACAPAQVANIAACCGLRRIEWGADVHARATDASRLAEVRAVTAEYGLSVCSYGSYWRAGSHPLTDVETAIEAAGVLGTSRIRIWAGEVGSSEVAASTWRHVVDATRDAADRAAEAGCSLAFEFHAGTLADTPGSVLRLLDHIDRANVSTYWQPPLDVADDDALAGLRALCDRLSAVHVFSWWPGDQRLPLEARGGLWRAALEVLAAVPGPIDLLLEFVPNDDPAVLCRDAGVLRTWLGAVA